MPKIEKTITHNELKILAPELKTVEFIVSYVEDEENPGYILTVKIRGEEYRLITARKTDRVFKKVETVIKYYEESPIAKKKIRARGAK